MAEYRFVTTWEFDAPIDRVWGEVGDPTNWANFWVGLERVNVVEQGAEDGSGSVYELVFKSFLPYTLALRAQTVAIEAPRHLEMHTTGELEGTAVFDLAESEAGTISTLTWSTRTTLAWMNAIAPVMRGLFEWNHDVLMRKAGDGLAHRMGVTVSHRDESGPSLLAALAPPLLATLAFVLIIRHLVARSARA
ncbi:MAG: SRPBCC family protein [Actinomycetota bacterium]|nr:SRPBCC family protein [Actinomycetota bacterium]